MVRGCRPVGRTARRPREWSGRRAPDALLAIARRRVPDGDFRLGDLEALPYADGSFDAILAADVLPYVAVPLATLGELRRVCVPGGRIVIGIWGTAEESEHHAILALQSEASYPRRSR